MNKQILVIAAHPDDEVLGMGGTLLKLTKEKCDLHIAFLSRGEASRGQRISNESLRMGQAKRVGKRLGARIHWIENFPDNEFDKVSLLSITKSVERIIKEIDPQTVYTHHHGDLNIDHRLTFGAVMTALRPGKSVVKEIFSFEVLSSTEWQVKDSGNVFLPNAYVDIEEHIDGKVELMSIYEREIGKFPFPRSKEGVRTLAKYRGMESGLKYAEAFELIRNIITK